MEAGREADVRGTLMQPAESYALRYGIGDADDAWRAESA